jgi:hypothetical protein
MSRFQLETLAAKYFNIPLKTFQHLVECGLLPGPSPHTGLFDIKALDAAFDRMANIEPSRGSGHSLDQWLRKQELSCDAS